LNRADQIMYDSLVGKIKQEDKHKDLFDEPKNENDE